MADKLAGGSYNGFAWGPSQKAHLAGIVGVDDLPPVRAFDTDRPQDHGAFQGTDFLGPRTVVLDIALIGDTNADFYSLCNSLAAAMTVQAAELPLYFFGSSRYINARPRRRSIPYAADRLARMGVATVEFVATDPRIYGATGASIAMTLPASQGGMTFNATFNLGFGSAGAGAGLVSVTNNGSFGYRPVITITGPIDNPILENVTTGQVLSFSISLAAGDQLVVDLSARTVLLNGANRRAALSSGSTWWEIAPGTSTLRFRNNGAFQAAAQAVFTMRDAYV